MKRRDFLKGATLVAGANAASTFAMTRQNQPPPDSVKGKPLGKIALEEHFMLPDFVEYFAETYPNISSEIAKMGLGVLPDFGDKRIEVMDRNRIDFVVLSLAGPGVQVEKDAAIALRKSKSANDSLAGEIQKRPTRYGGFAHLAMHNPIEAADELERCIHDLKFQGALINGQTNGEYLDLDKYSVFWERAAALEAPIIFIPQIPSIIQRLMPATPSFGARSAVGLSRLQLTRCVWYLPACSNVIQKPDWCSVTWGRRCLSISGGSTAAGRSAIGARELFLRCRLSTSSETSRSPHREFAPMPRCAARWTAWGKTT